MNYSTTDTYKMKREIMDYAKKFSSRLSAAEAKFKADMLYGMVASQSCLLTQISQRLHAMRKFMGINFFERCSQCHRRRHADQRAQLHQKCGKEAGPGNALREKIDIFSC